MILGGTPSAPSKGGCAPSGLPVWRSLLNNLRQAWAGRGEGNSSGPDLSRYSGHTPTKGGCAPSALPVWKSLSGKLRACLGGRGEENKYGPDWSGHTPANPELSGLESSRMGLGDSLRWDSGRPGQEGGKEIALVPTCPDTRDWGSGHSSFRTVSKRSKGSLRISYGGPRAKLL